jgi:hypothetical protein
VSEEPPRAEGAGPVSTEVLQRRRKLGVVAYVLMIVAFVVATCLVAAQLFGARSPKSQSCGPTASCGPPPTPPAANLPS